MKKNSVLIAFCAVLCGFIIVACGSAPADAPPATPGVVNLNKNELSITVGDTETLTASIRGVSWTSDNADIVSVDNSGKVTAIAPGVATITAAAAGNKPAECVVHARLIRMVQVNGGTFMMGNADRNAPKDEQPQHEVTVGGFYIGIYPITQAQYKLVMEDDPSRFKGDNLPVEQINWYDTLVFCNKLSMMESLRPAYEIAESTDPEDWGAAPTRWNSSSPWNDVKIIEGSNGYRLPTEAQWEYACRAGTTTYFHTGVILSADQANYDGRDPFGGSPKGVYREKTTDVDTFSPNDWGLYDMHGNVWEWCWDWHSLYLAASQTDPQGAVNGLYRVARGGSWSAKGISLRSSQRGHSDPSFKNANDTNSIGFRLVRP